MTAEHIGDGFALQVAGDAPVRARRLVLAHGVRDIPPEIPGLADNWGRTVLHRPYCHEARGRRLAILATGLMAGHQARMLRADWSDDVTLFSAGIAGLDEAGLAGAGIRVDARSMRAVAPADGGLNLALSDGTTMFVAALFLGARTTATGSQADLLGCALANEPMRAYVRLGPMGQTSVPGVFAAGNLARPAPNVNFAVADGTQAGVASHASLVFPDFVPRPAEEPV